MNIISYASSFLLAAYTLVLIVNTVVQWVKPVTWSKLPTNLLAFIVSVVLCLTLYFVLCAVFGITVIWYFVLAALVMGALVAIISTTQFDKLKEIATALQNSDSDLYKGLKTAIETFEKIGTFLKALGK